jgi:hypothetical protein
MFVVKITLPVIFSSIFTVKYFASTFLCGIDAYKKAFKG